MGCVISILNVELMGVGVANGGLPFPGTVYPVPDVGNIYLIWDN